MNERNEDPTTAHRTEGFPKQEQDQPGHTDESMPEPDHGESTYRGTGKLTGKRALVTGGDSGIGRAVAIAFAREGADVAISYLAEEQEDAEETGRLVEEAGRKAVLLPGDIQQEEHSVSLVRDTVDQLGGIDILVLNASGGMESSLGEDYANVLNRDAQVAMLEAAAEVMPSGSQVVFVTSHQAHFIDSVPTMDAYVPVARSKRAGEVALRERIPGAGTASTAGVAVEVGEKQAAVDLDIIVEYGASIVDLAKAVRRNVIGQVERMTGLEVIEVNIAVNDIHLPEDDDESESGTGSRVE